MAEKLARCGGCPVEFLTMGNQVGHCSGCHETFRGLEAFDRHQTIPNGRVICHYPGNMTREADGEPVYLFVIIEGVVYWSLSKTEAERERLAALRSTQGAESGDSEVD